MKNLKKPELLAPIQDYVSLQAAIESGADSVYFGVRGFNMRESARNFEIKDLPKITKICHANKVKVYLAINTIVYQEELKKVEKILIQAKKTGINAIICWDLAIIQIAKRLGIEIHLSTQASVANSESARFYKKLGAKRIVLARECSLEQIKKIKKKANVEIEIFIHGAMCVSISGRCFLSQFLYGKSANRGQCLQPCRRKYLIKQIDGNKELELCENYVLSPKDLRTIDFIEKILDINPDCLKVEGRNRSPEYVETTIKSYRKIIDFIWSTKIKGKKFQQDLKQLKEKLNQELDKVYNRKASSGFYLGKPINQWTNSYGSQATQKKIHIGKITHYYKNIKVAEILIQGNITIKINDELIFQGPRTGIYRQKINSMEINHNKIKKAVKNDKIAIKTDKILKKNDEVYVIRRK